MNALVVPGESLNFIPNEKGRHWRDSGGKGTRATLSFQGCFDSCVEMDERALAVIQMQCDGGWGYGKGSNERGTSSWNSSKVCLFVF